MSFRIQITSFAGQTSSALGTEGVSIGFGDSQGRRVVGDKPSPDGPGHRDQLHPTQRSPDRSEAGSDPSERQVQQAQRDDGG